MAGCSMAAFSMAEFTMAGCSIPVFTMAECTMAGCSMPVLTMNVQWLDVPWLDNCQPRISRRAHIIFMSFKGIYKS